MLGEVASIFEGGDREAGVGPDHFHTRVWARRCSRPRRRNAHRSHRPRRTASATILRTHGVSASLPNTWNSPMPRQSIGRASSPSMQCEDRRIVEPCGPIGEVAVGPDEWNDVRGRRRRPVPRRQATPSCHRSAAGGEDRRHACVAEPREHVGHRVRGLRIRCNAGARRTAASAPARRTREGRAALRRRSGSSARSLGRLGRSEAVSPDFPLATSAAEGAFLGLAARRIAGSRGTRDRANPATRRARGRPRTQRRRSPYEKIAREGFPSC